MSEKRVKLGLYGCGNRTKGLLDPLYGENEYEVVAVFDIRRDSAQSAADKYGGKLCGSAPEMLSVSEIEAFIISLDPLAHPAAFLETVQVGKPIFLEKPVAPTAEQAYGMMKEAEKRKVPVHVGLAHRYTDSIQGVRDFIKKHDPGRIFGLAYNWHQAVETEIINMRNLYPDNFRLKISQIPFHCCHALDTIRLIGGEIASVYAYSLKMQPWEYVTPDEIIALFEFKNGAIGHFHYSGMAYGSPGMEGLLHAENYTIAFSPWGEFDVWYRPAHPAQRGEGLKEDCRPVWNRHIGPDKYVFGKNAFDPKIMLDFLASVRGKMPMKVTLEDGYKAAEIAGAIELSYTERRKVCLPMFT